MNSFWLLCLVITTAFSLPVYESGLVDKGGIKGDISGARNPKD